MIDPIIVVSLGGAHPSKIERVLRLPWSQFAAKLAAQPPENDDKASRGWYSCTEFDPAYRHGDNFVARYCLTFDFDQISSDDPAKIQAAIKQYAYVMYTTHSHRPEAPRLRVVLPLSRAASYDEFQAVSRKIGERMGIELAARESHTPAQFMYLPVRRPSVDFRSKVNEGAPVDVESVLADYKDWADRTQWPHRKDGDGIHVSPENITPPTDKPGIVGDFCRAFTIYQAIDRFGLPYAATATPDRLTFTLGSRPEGAVVYDDATKLHSHHDTDPARGQHNAFDLVRLHKFATLDAGLPDDTLVTLRPSFKSMCELALEQPEIRKQLAQEFEVIEQTDVVMSHIDGNTVSFNAPPTRFKFKKVGEFVRGKTPGWLIKHHWPAQSFIIELGESGAGKTFSVFDKCAAIALGLPEWRGHRVRKGKVAYVCAEGSGGFRNRVRAYEMAHGVQLDEHHLTVLDASPNLYASEADQQGVIDGIAAVGGADVIVLDTVAATTAGANENSSDMANVLNYYTKLIQRFGATVVGVHHIGKDPSRGARGWSGIKAAADTEIITENTDGLRTVYVSKMKDGAEGEKYHFKLKVIEIDTDEDGDTVTSCVVDYDAVPMGGVARRAPNSPAKKRVFDIINEMGGATEPIPIDDVMARMMEKYTDARPTRIRSTINDLIGEGFVTKTIGKLGKEQVATYGGAPIVEESDE